MAAKAAVAGLAAILVVAMVVAVAVGVTRKQSESSSINAGSTKAVQSICAPTDYIDTCEKSLSDADTTDPKELIKAAFEFTEKNIGDVIKNSPLFKEAASDDSTKQALAICQEVLGTAIDDLKRSFDKVGEFDASKANEYLEDLKTWLSAVITNHETCIDAFENTTGDTGEKMKNVLQTARQMSSNGLAMVSNMSSIFTSLQTGSAASRKLLSEEEADLFISKKQRSLLALQPNAVVAQDGSGQFKTISSAIASVPQKNNQMFVIHVRLVCTRRVSKSPRSRSPGTPSRGLRVSGDRAIFHNVHIDGYQDTLYAHTYRQYYRDCSISGTIDFIFGDAQALFQNCKFVVRKPGPNQACMVTAQGRVERTVWAPPLSRMAISWLSQHCFRLHHREGIPWPPMEDALKDHYHAIQHRRVRCTRRLVGMAGNFRSRHTVLRRVPEPGARVGSEEPGRVEGDPTLQSTNG
ncbi:UNVERIFIED_CONTAM: putative pectinesterase/pectinesterase inhibitor 28 [Sesamum angustifolium]|uniref:Pectinesterase n=1 Tax=Sesamum angustifolium TaxID=2727405 RepID=A0AAW2LXH8_9LAMI